MDERDFALLAEITREARITPTILSRGFTQRSTLILIHTGMNSIDTIHGRYTLEGIDQWTLSESSSNSSLDQKLTVYLSQSPMNHWSNKSEVYWSENESASAVVLPEEVVKSHDSNL